MRGRSGGRRQARKTAGLKNVPHGSCELSVAARQRLLYTGPMPKELTHWMLAERALAELPKDSRLRRIVVQHRNAYLGGAVLPDTLAHIFRGPFHPTARSLSHRFHNPAGNSFAPLIRAERRFPDGLPAPLLSCFLGVICHMEADMVLHPYVYSAMGSADIGEHYRLETGIDRHFLKRGAAPAQRRLDKMLCPASKEVLLLAAAALFDPEGELPRRALEESLALHCRFQAMYDRTFWKLAVRILARFCGSPFEEQRHLFYPLPGSGVGRIEAGEKGEWRHPESGELKNASLDDLALEAVERTAALFRGIEEAGSIGAALGGHPGANLLTGLPGVKKVTG